MKLATATLSLLAIGTTASAGVHITQCLLPSIPLEKFGTSFDFDCVAPPQGVIFNTFTSFIYINGIGDDAAEIMLTITAPSKGTPSWTLTGADLGWDGQGVFFGDVETDTLNGPYDEGEPPDDTALFHIRIEMTTGELMAGRWVTSFYNIETDVPAPCPWDMDLNELVDTPDFLRTLAEWGTDPQGAPDFNSDGVVDTLDFMELLNNWGPCPE
jgi:hypothetical protein